MPDSLNHEPADWWKDPEQMARDRLREAYELLGMMVPIAPIETLKLMRKEFSSVGYSDADTLLAAIDEELRRRFGEKP